MANKNISIPIYSKFTKENENRKSAPFSLEIENINREICKKKYYMYNVHVTIQFIRLLFHSTSLVSYKKTLQSI